MHLLLHSVLAPVQMERSRRCQSIRDLIKISLYHITAERDLMIISKPARISSHTCRVKKYKKLWKLFTRFARVQLSCVWQSLLGKPDLIIHIILIINPSRGKFQLWSICWLKVREIKTVSQMKDATNSLIPLPGSNCWIISDSIQSKNDLTQTFV